MDQPYKSKPRKIFQNLTELTAGAGWSDYVAGLRMRQAVTCNKLPVYCFKVGGLVITENFVNAAPEGEIRNSKYPKIQVDNVS